MKEQIATKEQISFILNGKPVNVKQSEEKPIKPPEEQPKKDN